MRKHSIKTIVGLALILVCTTTGLFAAGAKETSTDPLAQLKAKGKLTVGCKVDVPSFGYKNINTGVIEGFEIDLSKAVAKHIFGDENAVEFTPVTAKTRGPLLDTGELDMVAATFTVTEERKNSWDFSTIYYVDAVAIMVKKDSSFATFKDLDGKTIGVAQSATTKKSLEAGAKDAGITLKYSEYATYPEIKVALDSGRIDAFSVDFAILNGYLEDSCKLLSERFAKQDYGIAVKKGNTALLDAVNSTIADLKKSGELDAMLSKWGLK
ncbi:transporter substrate-binding domain-containing protein [uncultured Sphaerochaeta sp.]|uniref:transporter substrate-binding domain-containing protein n=1 Tax=uncultured Sphaerochaeta sp. TaxID=886478 RepID=UPI002A0A6022|nr:transporter substrate-binding domain-containing protein [uncultured Sphaerochaeta sp.]